MAPTMNSMNRTFLEKQAHNGTTYQSPEKSGQYACLWLVAAVAAKLIAFGLAFALVIAGSQHSEIVQICSWANLAESAVFVACALFFLKWFLKSYQNLSHLGVEARFEPYYAMLLWFIPAINLWKPLQAVTDLWYSDKSGWTLNDLKNAPAPWLMRFWWVAWLIQSIGQSSAQSLRKGGSTAAGTAELISIVGYLVAGVLLFLITRQITERQLNAYDELARSIKNCCQACGHQGQTQGKFCNRCGARLQGGETESGARLRLN